MHGHDMGEGMKHSEDVLRRARGARHAAREARVRTKRGAWGSRPLTAIVLVAVLVLPLLSLVD